MNEQIKTVAGAPLFNPLAPEFIANPYPYYQRLRETAPMHLTPLGFYVASRHADIATVRDAGFGDAEIAEVVAHVGPNTFTNYFNHVAGTTIDFPKAPALAA